MTRNQKIAEAGLRIFADLVYAGTSTQAIAREANVSEALIFRHFGNKENLLDAVIKSGYKLIIMQNMGMLQERDALRLVHIVIDLPYKLVADEPHFWRLQARLGTITSSAQQHDHFIQPVYPLLVNAITKLGYANPKAETDHLLLLIDALWKKLVATPDFALDYSADFLKSKYVSL